MLTAWHGWAETVAAYRLLHTPDIGVQELVAGHPHATLARLRPPAGVLRVQDTTLLPDGTTHPQAGIGTGQSKTRDAYLRHLPVAWTPERVHGGGVGLTVWQRPEEPVAQQRTSQPMAEPER